MSNSIPYKGKNKIRIVTAASLFDGHDAAINIMRRIIQSSGAEVIHLGHNRSVHDIATCAVQEDVQAVAITSYQGGHNEYFRYLYDQLKEMGRCDIKIFGGGGGVILPSEIESLHEYGITRIYSPDDGRELGLQGMINDLLEKSDFPIGNFRDEEIEATLNRNPKALAQCISVAENDAERFAKIRKHLGEVAEDSVAPVLGITGTGGAGKSSLIDDLVRRLLASFPEINIGIISVDPSKRKTGGALLGDRIRMNSVSSERVYMRSLATRQANLSLSKHIDDALLVLKAAKFDFIILETSGIGQSDTEIVDFSDLALYVMTPEYGAATQLEKIDMIDYADVIAINKFDKKGSQDALRDVKKQYQRCHQLFDVDADTLPVVGTIASQFNDSGMSELFELLLAKLNEKCDFAPNRPDVDTQADGTRHYVIPGKRVRYLSEISDTVRNYNAEAKEQADVADKLQSLNEASELLTGVESDALASHISELRDKLTPENRKLLEGWNAQRENYRSNKYRYTVRGKELEVDTSSESLSQIAIPKVATPNFRSQGDTLEWLLQENFPGEFPYTAGVFPFKRKGEDPTRMFAGEGGPERTNRRFHYVSKGMPAKRLSTAFDSVTLYGEDPAKRPDIYGKIGNAGVSICCLDDAKKLYSGFDLCDPKTSVSMTINGPAPIVTAFFLNAAIDQQCERYLAEQGTLAKAQEEIKKAYAKAELSSPGYNAEIPEGNDSLGLKLLGATGDQFIEKETYEKISKDTLSRVRGTVQADILKEDQAQNTCIFSTEFALKLMGDMQEYFIENGVRNFYSVSISGYHIAEAGANPITQLAFTLANGFTYVEYYLSRGMKIDDFAPNLSFFFSNGIDPEYAVIGRVARRIWSKAMRNLYSANARSQKLKYHVQTSGRSLHAQEISFNDIRTTLQALYAIYDNCNSLHTNAYDEAITTPTEESVRRAMAIQLIINHELGLAKNENPLQGAFIIDELTELVEEAVLTEFDRLTERGGVLGAMESMYQRGKIQEESLYYETKKHKGEIPIIGVNTFLSSEGSPTIIPQEVIRSTEEEKLAQIHTVELLNRYRGEQAQSSLAQLKQTALEGRNCFDAIMNSSKFCSLGQVSNSLYSVGGQYRRNM